MRVIKTILYNGIILTITAFIIQAIDVSFNIYISNKIGTEALGIFGLISSVYFFAITIATSGINIATTRLIVNEKTSHPLTNTKPAMKKCILYSLSFGFLAAFLLCFFSNWITSILLHNIVPSYFFIIVAISLPFISVASALNGYFTAIRKANKNAFSRFFEKTIKISVTTYLLSLVICTDIQSACFSLILGETICEICSCIFSYFLYVFENKKHNSRILSKGSHSKQIFHIALPVAFASYIRSGISTLKQVIIPTRLEKFGMSYETAISSFGIVNGMAFPILIFPAIILISFSGLLIPEFSYYYNNRELSKIENVCSKIFRVAIPFSIGFTGLFWIYANEFSLLIYNNLDVAHYIRILSPLIIFIYLDSIIDSILKGLDKQLAVMKCNIFEGIISLIATFILLPILGITGYIISIYIGVLFNFIISIFILLRFTKIPLNYNNVFFKPFAFILILNLLFKFLTFAPLVEIIIFITLYGFYLLYLFFKNAKL